MLKAAAGDAEGDAEMAKSSSCDCDRAFGSGALSPLTHLAKDDDLASKNSKLGAEESRTALVWLLCEGRGLDFEHEFGLELVSVCLCMRVSGRGVLLG